MTLFWIIAAALLAAVLVVLLRPLLKPASVLTDDTAASNLRVLRAQLAELDGEHASGRLDAEQHAAARAELERRVLEEGSGGPQPTAARAGRASTAALALAVPVAALALYLQLGNRAAMDPAARQAQAQPGHEHAALQDMEVAVARLAEKLKEKPDNADGWALLGRSYAQLGRFLESRDAYAKALKLGREDAQLLADYADAMAMAQGRRFSPETDALVNRALALDPNHLKSLALAGTSAMARGDYALAVKHWTRARDQAPPDSELAKGIASGIAQAQAQAAGGLVAQAPPAAPGPAARPAAQAPARALPGAAGAASAAAQGSPAAPGASGAAAPAAAALRVSVAIAPALAARIQPSDTLFIFARAAEGPRMPLAIVKLSAGTLPAQVVLDDSMAMSPQMRLSAFGSVVVTARISRKGAAVPEPGDLEGESAPRPPSGSASITIDRVRP